MKVNLILEAKVFLTCKYLFLDPIAPNSGRKIVFHNITKIEEVDIVNKTIMVRVSADSKCSGEISLGSFRMNIYESGDFDIDSNSFWIYGELYNDGYEYVQGVIDVFDLWQANQRFDWFSQPTYSSLKKNYNEACYKYSGLGTKFLDKEIYQLDVSSVVEELDFFYLASMEFFGDKGYFGHDLHSFTDCLIEVHRHNGYTCNTILFLGSDSLTDSNLKALLIDIKNVLLRFKFKLI